MGKNKIQVLMVDDEIEKFSSPIKKICDALGYELIFARTISEAQKLINKKKFNMVISDLSLPGKENPLKFLENCEKRGAHTIIFSLKTTMSGRFYGFEYISKINPLALLEPLAKLKKQPFLTHKQTHGNLNRITGLKHIAVGKRQKQKMVEVYGKLAKMDSEELSRFLSGRRIPTTKIHIQRLEKHLQNRFPPLPQSAFARMDRKISRALEILKRKKRK